MPASPSVSVIIPVYNVAAYLAETVASVLRQSDQDYEIILVDDGSTDQSPQIARDLAQAHPGKIMALSQSNGGPGAARNRGVAQAKGEWLAFLDADDIWEPEKLAVQRAYLKGHSDVAIACGDVLSIDESGRPGFTMMRHKRPKSGRVLGDLLRENFISIPTTLVRRAAFEEVGGFCEDRDIGVEDYHLWLRIARRHPVGFQDQVLARYRIRAGSFSSSKVDMWKKTLAALDRVAKEDPALAREFAEDLNQGKARNHFEMGYHLSRHNDFAAAKQSLLAALKLAPGHAAARKELRQLTWIPKALLAARNRRQGA